MKNYSGNELAYELATNGFFVFKNVVNNETVDIAKTKLLEIYNSEINEYGDEFLKSTGELGQLRALILKDSFFEKFVRSDFINKILNDHLTPAAILHLINGIVTKASVSHNQASFHRDFPKPFSSSRPLSLNIFYPLVDFDKKFGGTYFLPGSHKLEEFPSEEIIKNSAVQINCSAGDVIIFDSMLVHAGGKNSSDEVRFAINTQFTFPFIKQQIDLAEYYKSKKLHMDEEVEQRLGCWSIPPKSTKEFRFGKNGKRTYRSGQG